MGPIVTPRARKRSSRGPAYPIDGAGQVLYHSCGVGHSTGDNLTTEKRGKIVASIKGREYPARVVPIALPDYSIINLNFTAF